MPEGYKHITYEERCQISALLKSGKNKSEIARLLNRDRRTISREILRNQGFRGYRYKQADIKSKRRRHSASCRPRKMTAQLIDKIEFYLRTVQASPEQISGVLALEEGVKISHERIYQHIWENKKAGGDLYLCLRRKAKKYNKRSGKNSGRGCIPNRRDISERPGIVNKKKRLGDWEADTVIGMHGTGVLVTLVDRMSKYTVIILVKNKTEELVSAAIISGLESLKKSVITITSDNGKEFAGHQSVALSLDASFYFATPYHSWERGLNEHTNGLIRQYLPKKTSFEKLTQKDIDEIQRKLNNRPRKILGFKTPQQVFFEHHNQNISGALQC